jgi:hypothetical protein
VYSVWGVPVSFPLASTVLAQVAPPRLCPVARTPTGQTVAAPHSLWLGWVLMMPCARGVGTHSAAAACHAMACACTCTRRIAAAAVCTLGRLQRMQAPRSTVEFHAACVCVVLRASPHASCGRGP